MYQIIATKSAKTAASNYVFLYELYKFPFNYSNQQCQIFNLFNTSRHGLRTPNVAFFSLKSRTFRLGQTNWADKFWGIWGIFGQTISTHFGTVSPLSMFSIIQPLFLQKIKPVHIFIWYLNLNLNLGRKN